MAESSYLVYYVYQKIPRPCFKFHKNLKHLTFVNSSSFLSEKAKNVGLSNILDSELCRRKPTKRSHRKVVGTTIVDRKLLSEVLKRIEGVTGIEPLLVFAVAAFNLAIMARCIRTDELVPYA